MAQFTCLVFGAQVREFRLRGTALASSDSERLFRVLDLGVLKRAQSILELNGVPVS